MKKIQGIYFGKSTVTFFKTKDTVPTTVPIKDDQGGTTGEIVPWGDDNLFPQNLLQTARKNGATIGGMKILKATHYGEGFQLYIDQPTDDGKRNKKIVTIDDYPEIKAFFKLNKMPLFFTETIADLEWFSLGLPEFILSNDYNKITKVRRQRTAWGRYEKMNEKTNLIENVYFKSDWSDNTVDKKTPKVPVIDTYLSADEIKVFCKQKKIKKFIMPIFYPMMDEAYYPKTDWHSSYHNGWMEVANSVPELKKYVFENQLHFKFIIYISDKYFEKYYQDEWQDFDTEKREEIRKELVEAIDEHMSGNQAGARSLTSPVFKDNQGNWVKGIEVVPVDDKLKDGSYLPDASAANSEVLFAQGVQPTLLGEGVPGGKLGAGSGSDKREAYSILAALFKTKRETTLQIWDLIRDYNGWDDSLKGSFPNTVLTTLDKNPTGKETTI